jgi:hypothetical protein
MILGEGAVAQALVHGDPKMARAAREAARVLLISAGVRVPGIRKYARAHQSKRGPVRGTHRRRGPVALNLPRQDRVTSVTSARLCSDLESCRAMGDACGTTLDNKTG